MKFISKILTEMRQNKTAWFIASLLTLFCSTALATSGGMSLGNVATTITGSFTALTQLITATSYLAGLGFSIGAILKFKQHKDNPTQIPIGTPIALLFIAVALLFLPTLLTTAGVTIFGGSGGSTATPTGTVFQ